MANAELAAHKTSHRFATADMMRAGAILLVMLAHLTGSSRITLHGKAHSFDYLGFFGVNTFFVLSGYLLARPYLRAILDPAVPFPGTRAFLERRFLRIYPLYAAAIIFSVGTVLAARSPMPSAFDLTSHFLFLHDLSVTTINGFDGPLWTMPIDAIFYLLLPPCCLLLGRVLRPCEYRARAVGIALVLVAITVCCLLYRYSEARFNPAALHGVLEELVYVRNAAGFAATFAAGIGLALISITMNARAPGRAIYQWCLFAAVCCACVTVRISYLDQTLSTEAQALRACFSDFTATLTVSLVLFVCMEAQFAPLMKLARSGATAAIASLAYAVYLIHVPIIVALLAILHIPRSNAGFFELTATALPVILIVAFAAHHLIEKPFLAIKDRLREAPIAS